MNKLSQKFMAGILVILSVSTCASALLNAGFVDKYYLHQKKRVSLRSAAGSWKQWMTAYPMKRQFGKLRRKIK